MDKWILVLSLCLYFLNGCCIFYGARLFAVNRQKKRSALFDGCKLDRRSAKALKVELGFMVAGLKFLKVC
jgi:uncharacterized membrane protein